MDELEIRRQQLSDPDAAIRALKERQNLTEFEQEQLIQLESFENELRAAVEVEVPDHLAETILLNTAMSKPQTKFFSAKKFMAMAASFAVISFISLRLFLFVPSTAMADDALEHIYHDIQHLSDHQPDAENNMMRAMKAVGLSHQVKLQQLSYAANCMVGKRPGVHLVINIDSETYTVLVLPNVKIARSEKFSDENFHGEIVAMEKGALIVIAMKDTHLKSAVKTLLNKFNQSQNS